MSESKDITKLLISWSNGDPSALELLTPLVMGELHKLAVSFMNKERKSTTLQPTALINEAFGRLIKQEKLTWQNRAQFFGYATKLMRHILVDYARARKSAKRGGGEEVLPLDEKIIILQQDSIDVEALHEALNKLEAEDERKAKIVEMKFFADMGVEEIAEILGVSTITVKREWALAKAWLHRLLKTDKE